MKNLSSLAASAAALLCALLPGVAGAAPTNIAQVPLLNISGTGTVKPNLMLLFDNSGSMESHFTPDNVDDAICRSQSALELGQTSCAPGHPPFMTVDFNRQYYNPRVQYSPPIKADGTYYNSQTAANTSAWSNVASDGFNKLNRNLFGSSSTSINLVSGFPDLKWCNPSNTTDCKVNTSNYTYPDKTYTSASSITGAPYYYNILIGEYCSDETLKTCISTTPGAGAPNGYPYPAKLRWCDTTKLTNCQAKQTGNFKWPRYSTPLTSQVAFATLTVGASGTASSLSVNTVTMRDPATNTTYTISNGAVTAATGTDTTAKRTALASALAASIIAKDKNAPPALAYWACVRTPSGQPTVSACSTYGLTLNTDDVVAILPVKCTSSGSAKAFPNCALVPDDATQNTRAGWQAGATVSTTNPSPSANWPATALINVEGSKLGSNASFNSVKLGSKVLVNSTVSVSKNSTPNTVANAIKNAINSASVAGIAAYLGGDPANKLCAGLDASYVCIADTAGAKGVAPLVAGLSGSWSGITFSYTNSDTAPDSIPIAATPISSGIPNAFVRVDIVAGKTYPKASARTDCAGSECTYNEEMTNFANWYTYYKSRLQMMKSAVGLAFAPLNGNYRVGYALLSEAAAGSAMQMKPVEFVGTARSSFYSKLYDTTTSGSTPSRPALDNVGRMFANLAPYDYPNGQQVVQFPCQQNFTLFTTDGYWNGGSTANVVNNDNKEDAARFCTKAGGCVDTRAQTQPSLADVALHWYNGGSSTGIGSLRPDLEPDLSKPGKVPGGAGENTHLHMNTFTLGLGIDGIMTYEANYSTAPKVGGDFYNLITGVSSGCPWNSGGAYVWPNPDVTNTASTVQARVDDLWHAAVNGHGLYFSANEPAEVVSGLAAALGKMQQTIGAASAAATSTPNISLEDNDIFSDTFTTVKWYGELADRKIDTTTGEVGTQPVWTTTEVLGKSVAASSDTRTILKADESGVIESFEYANLSALERSWFDSKCLSLPQCTLLSATDRAKVDSGLNLVNWLRGQQELADDKIFRAYTLTSFTPAGASGPIPIVLGDIASSKPAYLREPRKSYNLAGYADYKASNAKRPATVFTAANDGMLHAFNAANGEERFAYVPRITMKKLYNLVSTTYATNHIFTTDGSPELGDVQINGVWRTVLVAGLNGGGRGYYALDVTQAHEGIVKPLWELCADAVVCAAHNDPDLGLSFGNPQFGVWQGKWVVVLTSGYNNAPGVDGVNSGDGRGYLYIVDVATGAVLKKVSNGSGDAGTPSGLAKITAISDDPATNPVLTYIYGGDNNGKLWRFDLTDTNGAVSVVELADAGTSQPITARPDVTLCVVKSADGTLQGQRVVLFGTGRLLDVPDTTNTDVQSLYLIKDDGAKVNVRGASMVEQTLSASGTNTQTFSLTSNPVDLLTKSGWFFDWKLTPGERMNLDPKIVSGVANVVTNLPTSESSCSVGGTSNYYGVDVCNGTGINGTLAGATLSNTSAAVGFIIVRLPKGELKMITTTAKGETITTPIKELKSAEAHPAGWRRVKGE